MLLIFKYLIWVSINALLLRAVASLILVDRVVSAGWKKW